MHEEPEYSSGSPVPETPLSPVFQRIEADLRARIHSAQWPAGRLIPSRRALAKEYGVDLLTLQRAIGVLVDEGLLRTENRRGTFVADAAPGADAGGAGAGTGVRSGRPSAGQANLHHRTLGLIAHVDEVNCADFPGFSNPPMQVVSAVERAFHEAGGTVTLLNTWTEHGVGMRQGVAIQQLLAQGVDVIVCVDIFDDPLISAELRALPGIDNTPIVYVSGVDSVVPCAHVYYNNRDAGYKAAECLCKAGYREVVFFALFTDRWIDERIEGARLACQSAQPPVAFRVFPPERTAEFYSGAYQLTEAIVAEFSASVGFAGGIIATNDQLARRLMAAAKHQGREAGVDYGLVGFDDDPLSVIHGLTSVRPPFEEMGKRAAHVAIELLLDARLNSSESLRATLIPRKTHLTAAARGVIAVGHKN